MISRGVTAKKVVLERQREIASQVWCPGGEVVVNKCTECKCQKGLLTIFNIASKASHKEDHQRVEMGVFLPANKPLWSDLRTVQERYYEALGHKVEDHVDNMEQMSSDSE